MARPPARHAFRQREKLMEALHVGDQAANMRRILEKVNHSTPHARMVEWICYHGQLMSSDMARSILRALKVYAEKQELEINNELFSSEKALVEFNAQVVGLGPELYRASGGLLSADVDQVSDLAVHAGTSPDVIVAMSSGICILVPELFANRVAISASQVLKTGKPLKVTVHLPNETKYKPLGWIGVEQGKRAHQCPDTGRLRMNVIQWINGNALSQAA